MSETAFKEAYKKLNPKQKEAMEAIEGPVMVIAGPGTGKTTVLTLRIANILRKTDTPPDAILALTFTDSGVHAMREKLSRLVGPVAYQVPIHTFHSFCNGVIKEHPDRFARIIGASHMEEIEQVRIVQELLNTLPLRILRPKNDPSYYVKPVISAIKELKRENISPKQFQALVRTETMEANQRNAPGKRAERQRNKDKNKELARVYAAYERTLAKKRLYDFEDMIMETVRVLERDKKLLLLLQENYHYLLADEHQDANNAQNRLLELLASYHASPNLFIVGDEKQAIFRFQGASLENFLYFRRLFPKAQIITLEENYRSHQKILDAAHSLISQNKIAVGETHFPLRSAVNPVRSREGSQRAFASDGVNFAPRRVLVLEVADEVGELAFVAEEIKKRIKGGAEPREIAVLVRENKNADSVERVLRAAGVPVAKFSNADALSHVRLDAFLKFLEAVIAPSDEKLAPVLFFDFLNLEPHEVFALLENARENRRGVIFEMKRGALGGFVAKLSRFASIARNEPLVAGWSKIAEESGYLFHLISLNESSELLPLYESLLRAVERFAERNKLALVKDFLEYLAEAREHGLSISAEAGILDGVVVMTAHRAKGLEFESVFILHANDGVWGGRRSREIFKLPLPGGAEDHETEDERRLFYVALTRARKDVTVSYHLRGDDGRERLPSRFLEEISEKHQTKKTISPKPLHRRVVVSPPKLFADKKYLQTLFVERGLSVTHLNNFLKCPWRYFFMDLIRLPKSKTPALLYGSAIHGALKVYFDAYRREEDLSIKKTLEFFKGTLRRTHLSEREFQTHLKEGERELKGYLSHFNFSRTIWNEYKIAGIPLKISASREISLNGKLDKVELLPDGSVNVVDYKTGKPKSRNEIDGKTKGSDSNYKRQLVFYRLLIEGIGKWRMKTGTIDFIKPDQRGHYRREVFEITDVEVADLKTLIIDVSKQILSLSFWDKTCAEPDCEWCRLKKLLGSSF
ncbi:MAG TPA: hypothetical protein DEF00_00480 [Candidatus Taylorbacteria bacterium]|nr:MAG: UvrD/REP helicase [Parcubacteria group bacterium GW2011_GWA2_47_64]KKU96956.1 MAG: UvrD/REP helicase [Parcubacteria group bacterium GW2011_GWC2_48_17]HBV00856.1 hypothetical protein [Candidatus Taylorbacteria bacterium]